MEDTVSYTCDPGYELKGPKTLSCSLDGVWESRDSTDGNLEPRCQATNCPKPRDTIGRSVTGVTGADLPFGSLLTFTCSLEGHVIRGPKELVCGEGGRWSGPEPE